MNGKLPYYCPNCGEFCIPAKSSDKATSGTFCTRCQVFYPLAAAELSASNLPPDLEQAIDEYSFKMMQIADLVTREISELSPSASITTASNLAEEGKVRIRNTAREGYRAVGWKDELVKKLNGKSEELCSVVNSCFNSKKSGLAPKLPPPSRNCQRCNTTIPIISGSLDFYASHLCDYCYRKHLESGGGINYKPKSLWDKLFE